MTEEKKESNLKTLKNVMFVYTSVERAMKQLNKENKPPLSDDPMEFHSYEVKVLVTEKVFKAMKKAFKSTAGTPAKNFPNAKDVAAEDAEEIYGVEVDEDMVLIKFAQSALVGPKGSRKPSHKVRLVGSKRTKTEAGTVYYDNDQQVVAQETNIGNGSMGHLQFSPVETEFGLYLYPVAICLTNLVEYISDGTEMDEDAFGIEDVEAPEEEAGEFDGSEGDFDDDIPY